MEGKGLGGAILSSKGGFWLDPLGILAEGRPG